MRAHGFLIKT